MLHGGQPTRIGRDQIDGPAQHAISRGSFAGAGTAAAFQRQKRRAPAAAFFQQVDADAGLRHRVDEQPILAAPQIGFEAGGQRAVAGKAFDGGDRLDLQAPELDGREHHLHGARIKPRLGALQQRIEFGLGLGDGTAHALGADRHLLALRRRLAALFLQLFQFVLERFQRFVGFGHLRDQAVAFGA